MNKYKSPMGAVCDIAAAFGRPKSVRQDFFRQQQIKYGVAKRMPKFVTVYLTHEQRNKIAARKLRKSIFD